MNSEEEAPLSVLFVIGSLTQGGSESQLTQLIEATQITTLRAALAELKPAKGSQYAQRLSRIGVPLFALTGGTNGSPLLRPAVGLQAVSRLAGLIRRLRPDAVYAWNDEAVLVASAALARSSVPLVVARRGNRPRSSSLERVLGWAESRAAAVTVNSSSAFDSARRRGVASSRITTIANGHPCVAGLPLPEGSPVRIGYVARISPEKGHLLLLEAATRLPYRGNWAIDVAGSGPFADAVAAEAHRRGLSDRVQFLGPVDGIRDFWRTRSVAALLSEREGLPNALLEAAFAGRAIVGTDVGDVSQIVTPATGYLVSPGDPASAARALDALISSAALRASMGAEAHKLASREFALENSVAGHVDVLRSVVQRGG